MVVSKETTCSTTLSRNLLEVVELNPVLCGQNTVSDCQNCCCTNVEMSRSEKNQSSSFM
jgi:hypothetical protein